MTEDMRVDEVTVVGGRYNQEVKEEPSKDKEVTEKKFRHATIDVRQIEKESRRIRLAFSSEEPVEREFGYEVLSHNNDAIELDWLRSGTAPLLLDHDPRKQIGVIEGVQVGADKVARANVRFGKSNSANEIFDDIQDGIRSNVSVGYRINELHKREKLEGDNGLDTYVAEKWTPLELSIVSIPADQSVGVGRSLETPLTQSQKEKTMTEEVKTEEIKTEVKKEKEAPQVNVREIQTEAREAEIKRIREIQALGSQHNLQEVADKALEDGTPLDQFRGIVLEEVSKKTNEQVFKLPSEVGINEEKRVYSFMKAIRASATGDWREAGYEREISDEIARKTGKDARGFYAPSDIAWTRDQTAGTDSQGGYLVGTVHRGDMFIEALYGRSVVLANGAVQMQGLVGNIAIPRLSTSASNVAFVAEGSAPTEGAEVFAQVSLSPKTCAGYIDFTRKLMLQSDPSIEQVIRNDFISTFASKLDTVFLEGGGSNEPTGIGQTSGIGDVAMGTNGGAITYAALVDLDSEITQDNAGTDDMICVTTPQVVGEMRQTPKQASGVEGNFILNNDELVVGHRVVSSSNMPSNLTKGSTSGTCHAVLIGSMSQALVGFWSGLDVVVDSSSLATSGGTRLAGFFDTDFAVRHAQSFAEIRDVTIA